MHAGPNHAAFGTARDRPHRAGGAARRARAAGGGAAGGARGAAAAAAARGGRAGAAAAAGSHRVKKTQRHSTAIVCTVRLGKGLLSTAGGAMADGGSTSGGGGDDNGTGDVAAIVVVPALGTLALAAFYCQRMRQWRSSGAPPAVESSPLPRRTVHTMAVLCLWGFLGTSSGGMVQTPLTELLMQRACARDAATPFGTHACDHSTPAQNEATYRNTYLQLGCSIGGFVSLGVASVMADSLGRKKALSMLTCGNVILTASCWLLPMGPIGIPLVGDGYWLILVVQTLGSLFGVGAFLSVSMSVRSRPEQMAVPPHCTPSSRPIAKLFAVAYAQLQPTVCETVCGGAHVTPCQVMADVSVTLSHAGRTNMLMLLEAATWGGSMIGPLLGAKLVAIFSLRAVFGFATVANGLSLLVLLLGYTESLDPAQRIQFSWRRANPVRAFTYIGKHQSKSWPACHAPPIRRARAPI
jgi:hypothetical protein